MPIEQLLRRYPVLCSQSKPICAFVQALQQCYAQGGKLLVCGNGGSCADAQHIVGELMKGFALARTLTAQQKSVLQSVDLQAGAYMGDRLQQGLPAIDLAAHTALNTAFSNDVEPDLCFAQQAFALARAGDVFLGISTSGNARNVFHAAIAAKARGAFLVGMTGQANCRMDSFFDCVIHVPATLTYQVQELHLPTYHAVCLAVEEYFFGENKP